MRLSEMQNKDIIENLISLYGNDVLRIATAYTRNKAASEDIFQDVMIFIFEKMLFLSESGAGIVFTQELQQIPGKDRLQRIFFWEKIISSGVS